MEAGACAARGAGTTGTALAGHGGHRTEPVATYGEPVEGQIHQMVDQIRLFELVELETFGKKKKKRKDLNLFF